MAKRGADGRESRGVVKGEVHHDSNGNWSDGGAGTAASVSRSLGVERVVGDGKNERGCGK